MATARAPSMIVFSTSSISPSTQHFQSWEHGPKNVTGLVKRGRPRKDVKPKTAKTNQSPRFTFVDVAAGEKGKRAARRHAMREVRRRRKREEDLPDPDVEAVVTPTDLDFCVRPTEILSVDPFDAFPMKIEAETLYNLTSYATTIYEMLYSIEKYSTFNPVVGTWIPMAFDDAALLHAIMYCAGGYNATGTESVTAVVHLHEAVRLVNERLIRPVPDITDSTIVVVATLAHSEKLNNNHENWRIHMRGLSQMVSMRGGIEAFATKRMVRNKIMRADMAGSVDEYITPFFHFPHTFPDLSSAVPAIVPFIPPTLRSIYNYAHHFVAQLNLVHTRKSEIETLGLREDITALQYKLLYDSQDIRNGNSLEEFCSVYLLMFLGTLLDERPAEKSVCNMLGFRLERLIAKRGNELTDDCLLWIIFIASSLIGDPKLKTRFLLRGKALGVKLGLLTWPAVRTTFQKFLWVENIHGVTFNRIWNNNNSIK